MKILSEKEHGSNIKHQHFLKLKKHKRIHMKYDIRIT